MASLLILFLLPTVVAFALLRRHFGLVYYRLERAVTDILGFGHFDSAPTNTSPTKRCFRVSEIPNAWNKDNLVEGITAAEPSFDEGQVQVSLYPSCNGTGQTAVLYLGKCSEYFRETSAEKTTYVTISSGGSCVTVSIDSHFYDLTPLNCPTSPIIADVVAVNGLAGHAFESWKSNETEKMWLKDLLPRDVNDIRIMSYGYNANIVGDTVDDGFIDYRRHFIQMLANSRRSPEEASRPIIFIGHGTGGFLILQALLQSKQGPLHKSIYDSTCAVLFFGTPYLGLNVEGLLKVAKDGSQGENSRLSFIKQLDEHDNFIGTQREDIINLLGPESGIQICSFYPTKTSPDLVKSPRGEYIEGTQTVMPVKKATAQLFLQYEDRIPVGRAQSDLVKFSLAADATYQTVVRHIRQCRDSIVRKTKQTVSKDQLQCIESLKCYDCQHYRKGLLKKRSGNTCSWIFEDHSYKQWIEDDDFPVLWISGGPGFGKSVLSSVISERLESDRSIIPENNYSVAYFFYDNKDDRLTSAHAMLANVLGQLLKQDSELMKDFTEESDYCNHREKTNWSPGMLERVFGRITQNDKMRKLFLVIDALDECEDTSLEDFLKSIQHILHNISCIGRRLKILFTSRPHTPVQLHIAHVVQISLDRQYSRKDIIDYVKDGISKLDDLKLPIDLRDEIQNVLIEGANGMFLWVSLILDDLRSSKKTTRKAIWAKLKTLPNNLPKLYRDILNKIEPDDLDIAKAILQWVVWAARPLHVRELAVAIAIRPDHTSISSMDEEIDFNMERQIRLIFGPLIKIEDDTVYLVHQSAKDFLRDPNQINETVSDNTTLDGTGGLMTSSDESNLQIASICLTVLAFGETGDHEQPMDRLNTNWFQIKMHAQFETRIITYAIQNWINHVNKLSEEAQRCPWLLASFKRLAKSRHKIHMAYSGYSIHLGDHWQYDSSPLEIEAFLGHIEFLTILIDIAAVDTAQGIIYGKALSYAAAEGNIEIVRVLLSIGADVNSGITVYGNALQAAAFNGHDLTVRFLVENGADVNAQNRVIGSALMSAAYNGHEPIVRVLINNGADVNAIGMATSPVIHESYDRALQAAVFNGHDSTVRLLVDNGADINARCGYLDSALATAAFKGHDSTIRLLIDNGADVNARCDYHGSALAAAAFKGHYSIVRLLIENHADVNAHDDLSISALIAAASDGNEPILRLLIDNGANVNAEGVCYGNALQAAASHGHAPIVRLLIDNGADLNIQGGIFGNALKAAAQGGHETIVRLLIDNGVDVNAQGGGCGSALQAAEKHGHLSTARLLLDSGACR